MQNYIKPAFNQGTKFELTNATYCVSFTEPQFDIVAARNESTGAKIEFKHSHLVSEFFNSNLKFKNVVTANDEESGINLEESSYLLLDSKERNLVDYRFGYVEACRKCRERGRYSKDAIEQAIEKHAIKTGDKKPPSVTTVWRWLKAMQQGKGMRIALRRRKKTPAKIKCQQKREALALSEKALKWAIDHCYLKREKISVALLHEKLKVLVKEDPEFKGAHVYSKSTLYRRVDALPEYLKVLKREGYLKATREFPTGRDVHEPTYIFEEVELDHTQVDIDVVDEETRTISLGRPWLTSLICRKSRMVLGFYISLNTPSFVSIMHAVRHAIMPKDYLKTRYPQIENEWPCMGLFQTLIVDNGQDLHGNAVQANLSEICEVIYLPKGYPNGKGRVERTFSTINRNTFDEVPGRTDSNHLANGDYKANKESVMTIEDVTERLTMWLVDVYHVKEHKKLGQAPLDYWRSNPDKHLSIDLPKSPDALDRLLWKQPNKQPTLQKYGLELNCMKYQSPELMAIAKQHGFKLPMEVLFDEDDISWIKVKHPDSNELITVPCSVKKFRDAGVSVKEFKMIKAEARSLAKSKKVKGKAIYSQEALTAAYARLEQQKRAAVKRTQQAKRRAAKAQSKNSAQHSGTDKKAMSEYVTKSTQLTVPKNPNRVVDFSDIKPAEER